MSVASKDSAFRECLARRQTVESFSLDEIENRGKKAHDTHSVRTHEIKTDLFFNNFNCTWSLQNEGEETLVVEDLDCNLSTMCVYVCVIVSKRTTATT